MAVIACDDLDAPPVVFGSRNWITPAYEFEKYFFPQADGIIDVISQKILPIPGHVSTVNESEIAPGSYTHLLLLCSVRPFRRSY